MRIDTKYHSIHLTGEDAPAFRYMTPLQKLERSVMSCLLWEDQFYESGVAIALRIEELSRAVAPGDLAAVAIRARTTMHLRQVPLLLLLVLVRTGAGKPGLVANTIADVIQRPDEVTRFVELYWRHGKRPLAAQVKKGLAKAIRKFDAYQLAKYNRHAKAITLRDVLFLVHAKPDSAVQAETWRMLANGKLRAADTWEVALSKRADKRTTFERLIREHKLGYTALLSNLRGMQRAGVDAALIEEAILARKGAERILPFRYVAAARAAPRFASALDVALGDSIAELSNASGMTLILVDLSASMAELLGKRSDMRRMDAAAALAAIWPGEKRVFSFSNDLVEIPDCRGLAGIDAILRSQEHWKTYLGRAVADINARIPHDRLVVITDEQSSDPIPDPIAKRAYMINVASYENGVGYGRWTHMDGFSENVLRFIEAFEAAA